MLKLIHDAVNQKLIPGSSSALINDENLKTDVYGLSQYPNIRLQNNMIYDIASITKLFVSERIFQLIDDNIIKLDDTIQTHLDSFKNDSITIRQCLIHKTGFAPSASGRYTMDKEQLIKSILECEDLINQDNPQTDYSCINFIVLGMLIEKVDGVTLDVSLERTIFKPLRLKDTHYNPVESKRIVPTEENTPRGIVHDETARKLGGISGNAGILSTLEDLIIFARYTMKKRYALLKSVNEGSLSLGWNLHNETTLFHTGFTGPIIIMKDDKNALIILTNRVHPSRIDAGYLKAREEIMELFISSD